MSGLSNYPPGMNAGIIYTDDAVKHVCVTRGCEFYGKVVELPMYYELGGWFYADEDAEAESVCVNGCQQDLETLEPESYANPPKPLYVQIKNLADERERKEGP